MTLGDRTKALKLHLMVKNTLLSLILLVKTPSTFRTAMRLLLAGTFYSTLKHCAEACDT